MKRILITGIISILFFSCCSTNFKRADSGLEYKLFVSKGEKQRKLISGDLVELRMWYQKENGDTLFQSTSERKYMRRINAASHADGCFEDGLLLMSVGDSAFFRILADDFLLKTERYPNFPKNVKSGDYIIIFVKVLNVVEKSDVEHIITDKYHASQEVENELLQDYLKNANIPYQPNEDGIFIHKKQEGTGNVPRTTDYVTMHYTVTLIDGTFIETTLNKQPFTFRLGTNSVITGLEKAVLKMKTGEKSIVIIPSEYAYGAIETNNILPFSTLIFDVEILKIQ